MRMSLQSIAKAVAEAIDPRLQKLEKDVRELKAELAARSYKGVWDEGFDYQKHNLVTYNGSVWIAKRDTQRKPGTDDSWQLCVKKGRDGKDRGVHP